MGKKNWIAGATENKGALHRKLGVPEGENIPADKLESAKNSDDPTEVKEANLAETLKGMHPSKPKPSPAHQIMKAAASASNKSVLNRGKKNQQGTP